MFIYTYIKTILILLRKMSLLLKKFKDYSFLKYKPLISIFLKIECIQNKCSEFSLTVEKCST